MQVPIFDQDSVCVVPPLNTLVTVIPLIELLNHFAKSFILQFQCFDFISEILCSMCHILFLSRAGFSHPGKNLLELADYPILVNQFILKILDGINVGLP